MFMFSIKTYVTWKIYPDQLTLTDTTELLAKVEQMMQENKTDGISIDFNVDKEKKEVTVLRNWLSIDAANEWITFANQYNPVSTKIE